MGDLLMRNLRDLAALEVDDHSLGGEAADEIERLRADQADWRNGVELIASALGEANPSDLSCVRLSEIALSLRAKVEELKAAWEAEARANGELERRIEELEREKHPEISVTYPAAGAVG